MRICVNVCIRSVVSAKRIHLHKCAWIIYLCEPYKRSTNVCQVWMLRFDQHFILRACVVHAYILVLCWNSLMNGKCMCTGDLWQRGHIYQDRLSEARRHTHGVWSKQARKQWFVRYFFLEKARKQWFVRYSFSLPSYPYEYRMRSRVDKGGKKKPTQHVH